MEREFIPLQLAFLSDSTGCLGRGRLKSVNGGPADHFIPLPVLEEKSTIWDAIAGRECPFCHNRGKVKLVKSEELGTKPALATRIRKEISLRPDNFLQGYDRHVRVRVRRTRLRDYFACEQEFCQKKWYEDVLVDERSGLFS
jgi:hypothetical protein